MSVYVNIWNETRILQHPTAVGAQNQGGIVRQLLILSCYAFFTLKIKRESLATDHAFRYCRKGRKKFEHDGYKPNRIPLVGSNSGSVGHTASGRNQT